jgi:sugar lactone lactonase YvrE
VHKLDRLPRVLVTSVVAVLVACSSSDTTTDPDDGPPPPATAVGYLWMTAGSRIDAFTRAQTGSTSTALPALALEFNVGHTIADLALDKNGNIWTVGVGSNRIFRFRATSTPGLVTPDLIITSSGLNRPAGIAFDSIGNLWVVNAESATAGSNYASIVRFNNVQGLSGNQTLLPSLTINPPAAAGPVRNFFGLVHGIAFDRTGNLWVGGPSTIKRFNNPRNHSGTITPTPDGVISNEGYGAQLGFSGMIAFDASGALWITGCQGLAPCVDFAMKFSNPVFAGVSSPPPNIRLTLGDGRSAHGMAFDGDGSLWIIYDGLGRAIVRIAPTNLTANGTPAIATSLNNTTSSGIGKIAFFPTPAGLPVY